jgi:hypothetical protein
MSARDFFYFQVAVFFLLVAIAEVHRLARLDGHCLWIWRRQEHSKYGDTVKRSIHRKVFAVHKRARQLSYGLVVRIMAKKTMTLLENRVPKVKHVSIEAWIVQGTATIGYVLVFVAEGESPPRITKDLNSTAEVVCKIEPRSV